MDGSPTREYGCHRFVVNRHANLPQKIHLIDTYTVSWVFFRHFLAHHLLLSNSSRSNLDLVAHDLKRPQSELQMKRF
jgi:hypothetical protein